MGFDSGLTSITGTVTATPHKNSATIITGVGNNQTTTLGTVGAGKVWRVIGLSLSTMIGSAGVAQIDLNLNGLSVLNDRGTYDNATTQRGGNVAISFDYGACPVLTAGQKITLVVPASCYASASAIYVEENV